MPRRHPVHLKIGVVMLFLDFPHVAGYVRGPLTLFPYPELGYSVTYHSDTGVDATVYVYHLNRSLIPDGADSPVVREELERALLDVMRLNRVLSPWFPAKVLLGCPPLAWEALYVSFLMDRLCLGWVSVSEIYLTGYRNHFFKVRCSWPQECHRSAEPAATELLIRLGEMLCRASERRFPESRR